MKVLLDECTIHVLKRLLTEFQITTVQELGWAGITNGALLQLGEGQFDAFVTSDQNLKYQQNLAKRRLAIVQLPTNQVPVVIKLASALKSVLAIINPGEYVEIPLTDSEEESKEGLNAVE